MFTRNTVMHDFAVRNLTVRSAETLAGYIRRVVVEGPELDGFVSQGPGDHVRVFFPDPKTGKIVLPVRMGGGIVQRAGGSPIFRDYTPLRYTSASGDTLASLELEFVLHENPGPATAWAQKAQPGDPIIIAGPRGSKLAPEGPAKALLIADESALPALSRWLELLPDNTSITSVVVAREESVKPYLSAEQSKRANTTWLIEGEAALDLVAAINGLDLTDTYIWAAGEASSLIPLRRHLKYTLELDRSQYEVDGYWKRGISNLDHHAPLDESDPD